MNIYDIAKEAGVSISTVSRVLNNKSNVNAATRKKIQEILDKYQYTPSAIARGLVVNTMKTVAILTVDVRVPHYARTVYIVEREFSKQGYNVIVCNTGGALDETRRYARNLAERHVDGAVLVGSVFNELGQDQEVSAALQNMPVVMVNGRLELSNSYSIMVDDLFGISLAVDHLVGKGHREIVYVRDLDTDSARIKRQGFLQAMRKLGIKDAESRVFATEYGIEGGRSAARELLERRPAPTAVICGEDLTAVGVMKELLQDGIRIPEDIAVIGYNNSDYSRIRSILRAW